MGAAKSKVVKQRKAQIKADKKQLKNDKKGKKLNQPARGPARGPARDPARGPAHEPPFCDIELEPVFENEYLPQPNVMPLTIFEKEEMRRAQACPNNPCTMFEKIRLPPIDYYGELPASPNHSQNRVIKRETIHPKLPFKMPRHVQAFNPVRKQVQSGYVPFNPYRRRFKHSNCSFRDRRRHTSKRSVRWDA